MTEGAATATALLTHVAGLHARPSLKLTMLAKTFPAKIELALKPDGTWIDAKSIVKVMATKAPSGTTLHFRASGDGARSALDAIVALIGRDFDEAAEGTGGKSTERGAGNVAAGKATDG
jgi:phosphocarrier protein HPr